MPKILVVDDEATITTQLEERLTSFGYEVVGCASSGEEAVKMSRILQPDIVLMDIVMPGAMDGIEAAERVKNEQDIPVVFLTAYGDERYINRAKKVEPFGYIVKPFQENELRANIELALYNKKISSKLKDSEERWRSLVESINEGIILGDESGRIFFWNRGAENIFGYSPAEAIGRPLSFIVSEGFRQELQQEVDGFLSGKKSTLGPEKGETIGLRKDWSKFPLEISLIPWKARDNRLVICVVRDITERRRMVSGIEASLKEKEAQVNEIKKMVKDGLHVVYSLLEFQLDFLRGEQSLKETEEERKRMKSMARIREKIESLKATEEINFALYLKNLAHRLFQSFEVDPDTIRLEMEVDDIFLDIKTAIPCGLIASELISNALKYAFPGEKTGEISIGLYKDKGRRVTMVIRDNGVGFPLDLDYRSPDSVGLQIVNDLVNQLKGELRLDRRRGTEFKFVFEKRKD